MNNIPVAKSSALWHVAYLSVYAAATITIQTLVAKDQRSIRKPVQISSAWTGRAGVFRCPRRAGEHASPRLSPDLIKNPAIEIIYHAEHSARGSVTSPQPSIGCLGLKRLKFFLYTSLQEESHLHQLQCPTVPR